MRHILTSLILVSAVSSAFAIDSEYGNASASYETRVLRLLSIRQTSVQGQTGNTGTMTGAAVGGAVGAAGTAGHSAVNQIGTGLVLGIAGAAVGHAIDNKMSVNDATEYTLQDDKSGKTAVLVQQGESPQCAVGQNVMVAATPQGPRVVRCMGN